jgi:hypothetical protein
MELKCDLSMIAASFPGSAKKHTVIPEMQKYKKCITCTNIPSKLKTKMLMPLRKYFK